MQPQSLKVPSEPGQRQLVPLPHQPVQTVPCQEDQNKGLVGHTLQNI